MNRLTAALWLTSLAAPLSAQPPESAATQALPAGKWAIDYADWQCILRRPMVIDGKPTLFSLTLEPLEPVVWLKVAIDGRGTGRDDGEETVMFVDGVARPGNLHYNIFDENGRVIREYMLDLGRHRLDQVHDRIRFWTRKHGDIELQLEGFGAAWQAMTKCMADLYANFGISPSQVATVATPPDGDLFSSLSYLPPHGFDIALLYWVTATGGVDECSLLLPSGDARLDKSICADLKSRGRFKPARNANGEALRVPQFEHLHIRVTDRRLPSKKKDPR